MLRLLPAVAHADADRTRGAVSSVARRSSRGGAGRDRRVRRDGPAARGAWRAEALKGESGTPAVAGATGRGCGMWRKLVQIVGATAVAGMMVPAPARAQGGQAVSLSLGYFALRAEDARVPDDVLTQNRSFLLFQLKDFNGVSLGGDWLVPVGEWLEVGAGVGFHRRAVPSVYADYVDADGTEVAQELKLRVVPVTATVRFLPFGHRTGVQPYVGAGVGLYSWRYAETGEFIDFRDFSIFRASYVDSGSVPGSIVLGGIRFPVGRTLAAGVELQYQGARADLDPAQDFAGTKVDLSGWATHFTVLIRF